MRSARSMPSSIKSRSRSSNRKQTSTCGYWLKKLIISGWMTKRPTAFGTLRVSLPCATVWVLPAESMACRAASSISSAGSYTAFPASLSRSLRVVRCSSLQLISCSSRETLRLTAEGVRPFWRATAEKLPCSTICTKRARSGRRFKFICALGAKVYWL